LSTRACGKNRKNAGKYGGSYEKNEEHWNRPLERQLGDLHYLRAKSPKALLKK